MPQAVVAGKEIPRAPQAWALAASVATAQLAMQTVETGQPIAEAAAAVALRAIQLLPCLA
jgi:hypothetical protein